MSMFSQALVDVISKATKEYEHVAKNDPVISSTEDGTVRGDYLDAVINTQNEEKKELWDKLYKLQKERMEEDRHKVFTDEIESTAQRKQLLTLMYEHRHLSNEISEEMDKVDVIEQSGDAVLELEFHEGLDKQIKQYEEAIQFLQQQLQQTTSTLRHEKKVLTECLDVYDALEAKLRELAERSNVQTYPNQLREEQAMLESAFKQDSEDLANFLDEYYPPHPVDDAGPVGFESDLKLFLDKLMNRAFSNPDNPYIELVPGTYWTPYIQALSNAGILKYHPEDSSQVRLEDFRL